MHRVCDTLGFIRLLKVTYVFVTAGQQNYQTGPSERGARQKAGRYLWQCE